MDYTVLTVTPDAVPRATHHRARRRDGGNGKPTRRSASERNKQRIRARYTSAARRTTGLEESIRRKRRALTALGYPADELARIPPATIEQTFACGNPLLDTPIRPGDTVLDLGSGAGLDCVLLANRLHGQHRLLGLDITSAMVARARHNAAAAGKRHIRFGVGDAEALPLKNATVNVVISNGAICLTGDKAEVFREAFRVLVAGGRLVVTDLFHTGPGVLRHLSARLCGAVGTSSPADYASMVSEAGFEDVVIQSRRVFEIEEAANLWGVRPFIRWLARLGSYPLFRRTANRLLRHIPSIRLTAVKPAVPGPST